MIRVEIISNQSVEDDIMELIEQEIPDLQYTKLSGIMGSGEHSKKFGNTVWSELNFCLFAYTTEENARKMKAIIHAIKEKFPNEGISIFFTQGIDL